MTPGIKKCGRIDDAAHSIGAWIFFSTSKQYSVRSWKGKRGAQRGARRRLVREPAAMSMNRVTVILAENPTVRVRLFIIINTFLVRIIFWYTKPNDTGDDCKRWVGYKLERKKNCGHISVWGEEDVNEKIITENATRGEEAERSMPRKRASAFHRFLEKIYEGSLESNFWCLQKRGKSDAKYLKKIRSVCLACEATL